MAITTLTELKARLPSTGDRDARGNPLLFQTKIDSDPDIKAFFSQHKQYWEFNERQKAWYLRRSHGIPV